MDYHVVKKERKKEKKPKNLVWSVMKMRRKQKTSSNTKPVLDLHKDTSEESQVNTFKLKCDFCEKYFYSSKNLGIHVEICKKVNLPCEKCGKEYKSVKQFNNHFKNMQGCIVYMWYL